MSVRVLLKPLEKSGLSPNQITVLNFFVNNLTAVWFFTIGTCAGNLAALFFCLVSGAVDYIDGTLARIRGIHSALGEWLDSSLDFIWQIMLILGITAGVFKSRGQELIWLFPGFLAVIGLVTANYVSREYRDRFKVDFYKDAAEIKTVCDEKRPGQIDRFFIGAAAPFNFFYFFIFTIRYLVAAGALLNMMHITLVLIAIFSAAKAAILFYIFILHFRFSEGQPIKRRALIGVMNAIYERKSVT